VQLQALKLFLLNSLSPACLSWLVSGRRSVSPSSSQLQLFQAGSCDRYASRLCFELCWPCEHESANMAAPFTRERALRELELSPAETDESVIRRAYKRLALQHHPDKNDGSEASNAKFKVINAAYEKLTSCEEDMPEEEFYDDDRANAFFESMFRDAWERQQQGAGRARPFSFSDLFGGLFSFGGSGGSGSPPRGPMAFGGDDFYDEDIGSFSFKRPSWAPEQEAALRSLLASESDQLLGNFRTFLPSTAEQFYAFFGRGFGNLAVFSRRPPAPSLGDASTPLSKVTDFYRSWRAFKHCRSFKEEVTTDSFGFGAMKLRDKVCKGFERLCLEFVARAAELDPRLRAADAAMAVEKTRRAAQAASDRRAVESARMAAEREQAQCRAEEARLAAETKKEKEANRKQMQKARKRLRIAVDAAPLVLQSDVEELASALDLKGLTELAQKLEAAPRAQLEGLVRQELALHRARRDDSG